MTCRGRGGSLNDVLLKNPWLLPVAWLASATRGAGLKPGNVRDALGLSSRVSKALLHHAAKRGLAYRASDGSYYLCIDTSRVRIVRKGAYYACVVGSTVIVAKTLKKRVKWFTLPIHMVESGNPDSPKNAYRVAKAREVLGIE